MPQERCAPNKFSDYIKAPPTGGVIDAILHLTESHMNFRSKADRIIDDAHNAIATAEMVVQHSYTDESKQKALDDLFEAQKFLRRAVEAKRAWAATEHDEYDEYPDVV
jgi:hypothetical protein